MDNNEMVMFNAANVFILSYPKEHRAVVYTQRHWRNGIIAEWDILNGSIGLNVAIDNNDAFENVQIMFDLANITVGKNPLAGSDNAGVLVEAVINGINPTNLAAVNMVLPQALQPLLSKTYGGTKLWLTVMENGDVGLRSNLENDNAIRFVWDDERQLPTLIMCQGKHFSKIYDLPVDLTDALPLDKLCAMTGDEDFADKLLAWAAPTISMPTRRALPTVNIDNETNDDATLIKSDVRVIGISGAPKWPLMAALVARGDNAETLMLGDQAYTLSHEHKQLPSIAQVSDALHDASVVTALTDNKTVTTQTGVTFTPVLSGVWTAANSLITGNVLRALTDYITEECKSIPQRTVLHCDLPVVENDVQLTLDGVQVVNEAALPCTVIPAGTQVDSVVMDNNGSPRLLSFTIDNHKLTMACANGRQDWAEAVYSDR